jgi:pilus assembly protein Flp/PilA
MPGISATSEEKEVRSMEKIRRFLKGEEGVTAIEYGLIAALIAVAIITAVGLVGTNLTTTFNKVAGSLPTG